MRAFAGLFSRSCPYCRSIDFRKVGVRNSLEQAVYWLIQPYRCDLCGHHFFHVRWPSATVRDAA
jgi:hypothetical protein